MTGFSALYNAVSGLQSQSARISIASQNISNANTTGYKEGRSTFANLIGSDITNSDDTGGVTTISTQENDQQGDITPDSTPTNIAISGDGFFAVTQSASGIGTAASSGLLYTRSGTFTPDQNGNLVNGAGYFLQGWALNPDGSIPTSLQGTPGASTAETALQTVNVNQLQDAPVATTAIGLHLNLNAGQAVYSGTPPYNAADPTADMASGAVTPQFTEPTQIIDSTGVAHNATIGFLKTGTNTWSAEVYVPSADVAGGNPQIAAGTLTFNGDGTLASVSPSLTQPGAISWSDAADPSTISINWGTAGALFGTPGATVIGRNDGVEQLDGAYNVTGISNDGQQAGQLTGVSVSSDGFLVGSYSNGVSRNLYLIPVARFLDPNQLTTVNNTAFTPSLEASAPEYLQPGTGEAGTLDGSALESSNTNEDSELTTLIIAQQSYQFNSKLITSQDEMLQDLTTMVV